MKIIAFGHEKNVGKDTCCKFLLSYLRTNPKMRDKNIQLCSFAWKLKQVCYELFAWAGLHSPEFYEYEEHKKLKEIVLPKIGMSPRQIWIDVGNKLRQVYSHVWIQYLLESTLADVMIISDLRYPNEADKILEKNEADMVLEKNGILVLVERPTIVRISDEADDALLGYNKWNYKIVNNGSLSDLYQAICNFADTKIIPFI